MKIAIVGATGLVGRKILEILEENNLICGNTLFLYASPKSAGKIIMVGGQKNIVMAINKTNVVACDFALFSAGSAVSHTFAPLFAKKGAFVIDNSSAFRRYKNVPLVVPEINPQTISPSTKIIASPNCSTIGLVLAIWPLMAKKEIERIVVSTYQAVSGAGQKAINDYLSGSTTKLEAPIKSNLIPKIDKFLSSGDTFEENKMVYEVQKILNKKIKISATCVRVPILNCHSESVNITFKTQISAKMAQKTLKNGQKPTICDLPMPRLADGTNSVFVGRIRKDHSLKNTLNMFLCFDNLRIGAALNVVDIMQYIINKSDLLSSKK